SRTTDAISSGATGVVTMPARVTATPISTVATAAPIARTSGGATRAAAPRTSAHPANAAAAPTASPTRSVAHIVRNPTVVPAISHARPKIPASTRGAVVAV